MQVTMFKGLLPVNFPDSWFTDPQAVKFANIDGRQAIDFRPNGGLALAFWVEHSGSDTVQRWEKLEDPDSFDWGDRPFAIESRKTVEMFGQSGQVLCLKHLAN